MSLHTSTRNTFPARPVPNWSKLSRNDRVQVFHRDGRVTSGQIEMISVDRSVFWLIQDDGQGRLMVCRSDKPQVIKSAVDQKAPWLHA
ncbi:hypothetical protein [Paenarthrobacter sp. NPDC018779]|uniref:hypothetical protein n=1 Tax=Paenarthrobacter sp. NPDC018779 TaxID=3364375 RepID=UPI0037C867D4